MPVAYPTLLNEPDWSLYKGKSTYVTGLDQTVIIHMISI